MDGVRDPDQIKGAILESATSRVELLNLGCITQSWQFSNWSPNRSAVLGYQNAKDYENNPNFFGAIIGRVANRIENAAFSLGDKQYQLDQNDAPNSLHGGSNGLSTKIWQMDVEANKSVHFRYHSPHLEGGYPGSVDFSGNIELLDNTLHYQFCAEVSEPTPISLTQHNYYNIGRENTIWRHKLTILAQATLRNNENQIPVERAPFADGIADFRNAALLMDADRQRNGIDQNYCLVDPSVSLISLESETGASLTLKTDQPGLQLYTGAKITRAHTPFGHQTHAPFSGLCLEPQGYPNAVNRPDFPSIIVTPEKPYKQTLSVTIQPGENDD